MERKINASITYPLLIEKSDYTKDILSHLMETDAIKNKEIQYLRVVFMHISNTDSYHIGELHFNSQMIFEVFLGFNPLGMNLYSIGCLVAEDIVDLCQKYESDPDFIFTQLEWDSKKEKVIKGFISDLN